MFEFKILDNIAAAVAYSGAVFGGLKIDSLLSSIGLDTIGAILGSCFFCAGCAAFYFMEEEIHRLKDYNEILERKLDEEGIHL